MLERISTEDHEQASEAHHNVVDLIDTVLPEIERVDEEPTFRGKTLNVQLTDTPNNGHPGWKAYASAKRSGWGSVCVDTKSKVGNNVVDPRPGLQGRYRSIRVADRPRIASQPR
ncbi:MAG: hypothetical protein K0V04_40155 [Deltaproteobacteria bacterium]|nr:hypothetical protein [Deltaproteobacteria bacterium]